ncbi:MarR family transcriptional regulator [Allobranchiibius sp. GilTou38]|uniref:MarR family winged helix-turn-helix transcriptional regulator n=1 Tax=Allobranchiibius sp. GilTou38 TaxID=2815210 RepID=UPI001AA12F3A|nr:MarR family transcriptional regulator [Allobranchiibius sp. GilTou38]MBO1765527.1 MarR family transcriptional regulator [Allobranchiibius sp. GilTou38]
MTNVDDTGARLLMAVARLNRWATRHADFDTPPAQARLLSLVEEIGPARIGDLAAADHCSQPTMTTQVQRVEAAGWVRRRSDPGDARVALIDVTPAGRAVLNKVRTARRATLAPVFDTLSDSERESVARATALIERIIARSEEKAD